MSQQLSKAFVESFDMETRLNQFGPLLRSKGKEHKVEELKSFLVANQVKVRMLWVFCEPFTNTGNGRFVFASTENKMIATWSDGEIIVSVDETEASFVERLRFDCEFYSTSGMDEETMKSIVENILEVIL